MIAAAAQSLPGDFIKSMSTQVFRATQYFAISWLSKMQIPNADTKYILKIFPIIMIQYNKSNNLCFMASSTRGIVYKN